MWVVPPLSNDLEGTPGIASLEGSLAALRLTA